GADVEGDVERRPGARVEEGQVARLQVLGADGGRHLLQHGGGGAPGQGHAGAGVGVVDQAGAVEAALGAAVAASIEWVKMVEQYADAKAAIESAKSWQLKIKDPKLARELEAGQITEMA